jgi:N-acetylglucosaminyldiphosphoundecaprenol N-acetyl-beta-D-mannosaminyltransferase
MSEWMDQHRLVLGAGSGARAQRNHSMLRLWDVLLASALLLVLGLPYLLARLVADRVPASSPANDERVIRRHSLQLPATGLGRFWRALGAASWPVVLDVWAGRMAWVGPTTLAHLPAAVLARGVRPGVVTLWSLRQRTAVGYASEVECDHEYLARRGLAHDIGLLLRACLLAPLPSKPRGALTDRVAIGDVAFDNLSMQDALVRLEAVLAGTQAVQVSFVNPACVNIAAHDRAYRRALARASLVLPDGIGIKVGADILGSPLKQNVNGTDLFPRLCALMERRQSRLYLLGGQPGVPEAVAEQIRSRWPEVQIVGQAHGFFSVAEEGRVVADVKASGANVVLVARGVPSQDVFIDRYLPQFGAQMVMGVGGLFDFVAGRINRAPQWMRDSGLEWVYRLMQEPGRMWRRYLLGNFSFLARVLLQRAGLRQPAVDAIAVSDQPSAVAGASVQAVVFACAAVDASIPSDSDQPAALLPLGYASFLERALEHLSEAGVRQVHLVVSHRPEALRRVVGQGERWGLSVQWHLAKDDACPYGVMASMDWHGVDRVLVGHAERWIGRQAVRELSERDAVAWVDDPSTQSWAGWVSASPLVVAGWPVQGTWDTLSAHLYADHKPARLICASARTAWACRASDLVAAQLAVSEADPEQAPARQLPGSWIKTPWGGMSPSARVHPQAVIEGPVLLGPGCLVDAQARIGPNVVLVRDVVVTRGSSVVNAVVLPNTFIGEGLSVKSAVVEGTRLHQLDLGVTIELPGSDGLLMVLRAGTKQAGAGWLGRSAAAAAWVVLYLPAAVDALLRSARALPPRSVKRLVASGQLDVLGEPTVTELWIAPTTASSTALSQALSLHRSLADVVQGRRTWLGRRPLSPEQFGKISSDWRQVLMDQPIGLVHAPAWGELSPGEPANDDGGSSVQAFSEAEVAADVFLAVQTDSALRRRLLWGQLFRPGAHASAIEGSLAVQPPVWRPSPSVSAPSAPRQDRALAEPSVGHSA